MVLCSTKNGFWKRIRIHMNEEAGGKKRSQQKQQPQQLGLLSVEKRRLRGDLLAAFQYMRGASKPDGERLLARPCSDRTRGSGFKLKEGRLRLDRRRTFVTMRGVGRWHRLPRQVVDAPSLEAFEVRLDGALSTLTS